VRAQIFQKRGDSVNMIKKLLILTLLLALFWGTAFSAADFLQTKLPPAPIMATQEVETTRHSHDFGMLNGYKGYRHHRPGFRRHKDGWWYPKEAFNDASNINKTSVKQQNTPAEATQNDQPRAANNRPSTRKQKTKPSHPSSKHIAWCAKKYRSYRAFDNTFQPKRGKRKTCRSPY